MQVVIICEIFGWTYEQYQDQPTHFIALIKEKLKIDAQKQKAAQAKSK